MTRWDRHAGRNSDKSPPPGITMPRRSVRILAATSPPVGRRSTLSAIDPGSETTCLALAALGCRNWRLES